MVEPSRPTLVIEQDLTRIESMAVALRAAGREVAVVDAQDGRAALARLQELLAGRHAPDVAMVRLSPTGWTTAALLATLRSTQDQLDVVLVVEGTRDMLPVTISDFTGIRLVAPDRAISTIVDDLGLGAVSRASPR
jgi:CheY-like chemotaxis protein